jgi:hypothetical protein
MSDETMTNGDVDETTMNNERWMATDSDYNGDDVGWQWWQMVITMAMTTATYIDNDNDYDGDGNE